MRNLVLWNSSHRSLSGATSAAVLAFSCLIAARLIAQGDTVRVGISVTEKTNGLIESAFRTALSQLHDVVVVTAQEKPDILLRAVVMCEPNKADCESATNYVVAIGLVEPMDTMAVWIAILSASGRRDRLGALQRLTPAQRDSIARGVTRYLKGYETHDQMWVATWGRNAYRQAIDELVAELDSKCFERHRLGIRARQSRDTSAARVLDERLFDTSNNEGWICELI